jgi:ubiquinol-cytochrome c reductase cytochrome b subunit
VGSPTLVRFFCFHFFVPIAILGIVGGHLIFLHETGSRNPLGLNRNFYKIVFSPYFIVKDLIVFMALIILFEEIVFFSP